MQMRNRILFCLALGLSVSIQAFGQNEILLTFDDVKGTQSKLTRETIR